MLGVGCGVAVDKLQYVERYQKALTETNAVDAPVAADDVLNDSAFTNALAPQVLRTVKNFAVVFTQLNTLSESDLIQAVNNAYAESLYFNDTFHTLSDRDAIAAYLVSTGAKLKNYSLVINDVVAHHNEQRNEQRNEVYVRWTMRFAFSVFGQQRSTRSVGITHLRIDDQGKIILHQDFWDGVEGFYRELPVLGNLLNQVQSRM